MSDSDHAAEAPDDVVLGNGDTLGERLGEVDAGGSGTISISALREKLGF